MSKGNKTNYLFYLVVCIFLFGQLPAIQPSTFAASVTPTATLSSKAGSDVLAFQRDGGIYVINANGTEIRRLTSDSDTADFPNWSPDRQKIAVSIDGDLYIMDSDGANRHLIANEYTTTTWSPDGQQLAFICGTQICVAKADGSTQLQLTSDVLDKFRPSWSPDGKHIMFYSVYRVFNSMSLWIMNKDGNMLTPLTEPHNRIQAVWLKDRIVFSVNDNDSWRMYVINPDGTGLAQLLDSSEQGYAPVASPDGVYISYLIPSATGQSIMKSDGTWNWRLDYTFNPLSRAWSPDSKTLAYTHEADLSDLARIEILDVECISTRSDCEGYGVPGLTEIVPYDVNTEFPINGPTSLAWSWR